MTDGEAITAGHERARDALLVILTLTTGATDATAFLRLGHVFASVITGNLVLLGVSATTVQGDASLFAGVALLCYGLGVVVGAAIAGEELERPPIWPDLVTSALAVEFVVLVAFAVTWEAGGSHPGRGLQIALLAVAAGAMGMQSASIRRLGQMSTTYLTSTMTGIFEVVITRRWTPAQSRSLAILISAAIGAAAGAALVTHAHDWLPALQLLPLAIVIVVARRLLRPPLPAPPQRQQSDEN